MQRSNRFFFVYISIGAIFCLFVYTAVIIVINPLHGNRKYFLYQPANNKTNTPETKIGELEINTPYKFFPVSISAGQITYRYDSQINVKYEKEDTPFTRSGKYNVDIIGSDLSTFIFWVPESNMLYYLPKHSKSGKAEPNEHPSDGYLGYFIIIRSAP